MCSDLTLSPPSSSNEDSKLKSAYSSLIIDPIALQCKTNLYDVMA